MILQVCREIKNFFQVSEETGTLKIENGVLTGHKRTYPVGSYICVTGSLMSNNIYLVNDDLMTLVGAKNEEFRGTIYQLAPPFDFLELVEEIKAFVDSPAGETTIYVSESFGIDSRSRATGKNGTPLTWKEAFASKLHGYRRMFLDINI